jgi:hypothetical protein
MNHLDLVSALKIQKLELKIRKPKVKKTRGSDIEWFNPCGDQVTHFTNYTGNPNTKTFIVIIKK